MPRPALGRRRGPCYNARNRLCTREEPLQLLNWLLAIAPIVVVLVLMVVFRWGGDRAGPVGWLAALLIAVPAFGAGPALLAYSQLEGLLLSLYVLYIIWMALVLYRVVEAAGAIRVIGGGILRLSADPVLQLLILAFAFSSFLQGVAGFGVPIAVVAPLLVGLGFKPVVAVATVAIGHSWSVTFGDISSSFNALIAATGLPGHDLAPWSGFLLAVACLLCGLAVVHVYRGGQGLRRGLGPVLLMGGSMALTQHVLAVSGLWNLAGFAAGMVGLAVGAAITRLPGYRTQGVAGSGAGVAGEAPAMPLWMAVLPYLLLIVLVAVAVLWQPLHDLLDRVRLSVRFPAVETRLGFATPARTGREISLFGHPGALLAYASVVTFLFYRLRGHLAPGAARAILGRTVRGAMPSTIGIVSMVGMALIMDRSGMTHTLALGLSRALSGVFPLVSPFIGLLGAFMTGSNTNSNVVFAPLQKATAELLGLNVLSVLGAQTTGGSLGSMIAPAKIIVGCSTAGLAGQEGRVLRRTVPYALLITAVVGLIAWVA